MDKRKLAGTLSLGALAAGAGSTASAWNPLSLGAKKVKSASDKIRELLTKSKDHKLKESHDKIMKNENGYGAAINIAYRIYDILEEEDKKLLINKLKNLCINYQNENKVISDFKEMIANAKKNKDEINKLEEKIKSKEAISKYNEDVAKAINKINKSEGEIKNKEVKGKKDINDNNYKEDMKEEIEESDKKNKNNINENKKMIESLKKGLLPLRKELVSHRDALSSHRDALSSYSNLLLKMAKDIGIEDGEIDKCFTDNISGYQRSSNECNVKSIKMRNNAVIDDDKHKVYDFYIYKFNEGLSFSKKIKGKLLKQIHYSSNNEFHNEEAVLKVIENLEKKVFNLENDKNGEKALKLIVSLIINKYVTEIEKGKTGGHKDILKQLLELEINGDDKKKTKFKDSKCASLFIEKEVDNKKINLLNNLAEENVNGVKSILTVAADTENADNVFSAKTKGLLTKIADNKITRLSVTGAGAYFGGMVLAPALGLGLVGTTLLATGTASAANAVTDYVSDKNARDAEAWSKSRISARYKSLSTRIPMTLTVCSAKTIFRAVKGLTSNLLK